MKKLIHIYSFLVLFIGALSAQDGIPEDWDTNGDGVFDNSGLYDFNLSIVGRLFLDDIDATSTNDAIAAFVDGQQRGFSIAYSVPEGLGGGYAFMLLVYSNIQQGEEITLQIYNAETFTVYNAEQTYIFQTDLTIGDLFNPEIFTPSIDCLGIIGGDAEYDCAGVCDGSANYDNCGECDKNVAAAIERYSVSNDIIEFEGLSCDCEKVWRTEIDLDTSIPIPLGVGLDRRISDEERLMSP